LTGSIICSRTGIPGIGPSDWVGLVLFLLLAIFSAAAKSSVGLRTCGAIPKAPIS